MQSLATRDANKGGVTAAYETTGGPVQYSGGYGNHMDAGLMRRLMFSYLAAGNEVIAFWDWICRPGGIEAGEYGLVTLGGQVSDWAREAGRIAKAMARFGDELWNGSEEPELAIFRSWDSEAITMLEPRRFETETGPRDYSRGCGQQHLRALIGAGRAAIDHQVAYEYLHEAEVMEGIAGVFPTIYLPHVRACSTRLLEALLAYIRRGGRLIADVQFAFHDPWGKMQPRGPGALATRLFGAWVDSIHDARTRPQSVDGMPCEGFYGDVALAGARAIKRFADGRPAVTEANIGRGQAILIGFDPARQCWKPGQSAMEALLADLYRGEAPRRWWSDAPLAFRRSHAKADHWFLINDGPARTATLRVYDRTYRSGCDAVSGRPLDTAGTVSVELPAYSAAWLRLERARPQRRPAAVRNR
jgi:beta-galactosidase